MSVTLPSEQLPEGRLPEGHVPEAGVHEAGGPSIRRLRPFAQVDVFSKEPYRGNPLAVVLDAEGIDEESLARFANWTNLSETTFILRPSPEHVGTADYRVRIFTPSRELPFAGHPTLGTAHAWLEAGGVPLQPGLVVQECGVGLVSVRQDTAADRLAFGAPPLIRSGPIDTAELAELLDVLGLPASAVVDANWVVNGPPWAGILLASAAEVLAVEPDFARLGTRDVGLIAPRGAGGPEVGATGAGADYGAAHEHPEFEVRGFAGGAGVGEDPVTGSLNAGLAQWMIGAGHAPHRYVARQGARLGRDGHVFIEQVDGQVWVGGHSVTAVRGTVLL